MRAPLPIGARDSYDSAYTERLCARLGPPLAQALRLQVTGLENLVPDRPGILAINHNAGLWGILDIAAMFHIFYNASSLRPAVMSAMSGEDVFDLPVLGTIGPKVGLKVPTVESLGECLDAEQWVLMSPGGNTDMLRPIWQRNRVRFKQSLFLGKRRVVRDSLWYLHSAFSRGRPVYPVAISGTHEMAPILWESPNLLRWTGLQRMRAREALPGFPITLNHLVNLGLFTLTPFAGSLVAWLLFAAANVYVDLVYLYPLFPIRVKVHIGAPIEMPGYSDLTTIVERQRAQQEVHTQLVDTINSTLDRLDSERWWHRMVNWQPREESPPRGGEAA